ncbi:MAG TPA: signal peptidase I [Gemmatimonadales bacterium]|nr:signal peptidase I [Gemmatimonadales bacterium]
MTTGGRSRGAAIGRWLIDWVKSIAIALAVWLVVRTFVVEAFRIPSGSMQQTLQIGDFLFVNKFLYGAEVPLIHKRLPAVREPERGEIIVFDSVDDPDMKVVKRLIGIPGDTLEMRGGLLYRNGELVEEPYTTPIDLRRTEDPMTRDRMRAWQVKHFAGPVPAGYRPDIHDWGPIVVPGDSLFVMGDNRDGSYDGRYWGFLPRINLRGTPVLVYYSFDAESIQRMAFLTEVRWDRLFTVPD